MKASPQVKVTAWSVLNVASSVLSSIKKAEAEAIKKLKE